MKTFSGNEKSLEFNTEQTWFLNKTMKEIRYQEGDMTYFLQVSLGLKKKCQININWRGQNLEAAQIWILGITKRSK